MKRVGLWLLPALAALGFSGAQSVESDFDLLLVGGQVIDGSGNPWFYADVGVRDGRIAAVGRLEDSRAARRIDVSGKVITPGFIDLHSHADDASRGERGIRSDDARRRAVPNMVAQGVTTLVSNQDGRSPLPIGDQRRLLEVKGIGPNVALLVGHGSVRSHVLGRDHRRSATAAEIEAMREVVREAMQQGAFGMSAGLEYVPGRWSTTEEVIALVEEITPWDGVYISHERSEGADPMWYLPSRAAARPPSLLDAVRETIRIGEETGATVVATHLKAKGSYYWGSSAAAVRLIQEARDRGVRVWADQYPYATTGSDGSTVLIPGWISRQRGEAAAALRRVLEDPVQTAAVRRDIAHEIARRGGAGRIVVFEYPDESFVGRNLAELAAQRGVDAVDMAIALQLEGFPGRRGGARLRGFSLNEEDIERIARQPWAATASDAGVALPGDGFVHARFYGTFPRKIRRYAIERGVLSVESAVRSMTSLPALILGLRDRGLVREGMAADLVVLDLDELADTASFFEPHQYPAGIDYVFLSGRPLVDKGELTWRLEGRVLTPADRGVAVVPSGD